MKFPTAFLPGLLTLFLAAAPCALAQNFGSTETHLRDLTTAELFKPAIPADQVGDPDPTAPVNPNDRPIIVPDIPRPIHLIMRYYSCQPWYPIYVKDVFTSAVASTAYKYVIDTAGAVNPGDNVEGQIVTDIDHPAYGLYCLRIAVAIPWDVWQAGPCRRFYVRWAYGAPYYCWLDHWWYYWQRPCISVPLNAAQEVANPPVVSNGTGTGTLCRVSGNFFTWTLTFTGLTSGVTAAHIHGPASAGQNAGVAIGFDTTPVNGQTSGTLSGSFTATAAQAAFLASGQGYFNIHTTNFGGGEIRGQLLPVAANSVWCPWGPSWWPWLRWNRIHDVWGLTVTHPYCYRWHPGYAPRPFCLYGLQHFYTPLGANALAVRSPAQEPNSEFAVPLNNKLDTESQTLRQWTMYNSVTLGGVVQRPIYRYWPYTPYCSRWYWWRPTPFTTYRYNPPVIRFGLWQGASNPEADFPDAPNPALPGTIACFHSRSMVLLNADVNGDGNVNVADRAHERAQFGTRGIDSFFDVFTELE